MDPRKAVVSGAQPSVPKRSRQDQATSKPASSSPGALERALEVAGGPMPDEAACALLISTELKSGASGQVYRAGGAESLSGRLIVATLDK